MNKSNIFATNPYALVTGVTKDWAFAAGIMLTSFKRHNPDVKTDIIVFSDGKFSVQDSGLMQNLGVQIIPFTPYQANIRDEAIHIFSHMSLSKFLCLELINTYESVVWLDADVIIQDNISELFSMGPFGIACEDACFYEHKIETASINLYNDIAGYDNNMENLNSGVLVFQNKLKESNLLLDMCLNFIYKSGPDLRYPDQAAFNFLAQHLQSRFPDDFHKLPQHFNMHPKNPEAAYAPIVHPFGAYKLWNDGLTATCFPEWQRDYNKWRKAGGSAYEGPVDNANFLEGNAFSLLSKLYDSLTLAESTINDLKRKLEAERYLNSKLESALQKINK